MTQEQKDLLFKDLCARLPYGVNCKIYHKYRYYDMKLSGVFDNEAYFTDENGSLYIDYENVKPYLFPISSMTEEQKEELDKYLDMDSKSLIDGYKNGLKCAHPYFNVQDWYNKNHFDYRGLISIGLAIDATGLDIY